MPLNMKNPANKEIARIRALPRITGHWLFNHGIKSKPMPWLANSQGEVISPKRTIQKAMGRHAFFDRLRNERKARWAALGHDKSPKTAGDLI